MNFEQYDDQPVARKEVVSSSESYYNEKNTTDARLEAERRRRNEERDAEYERVYGSKPKRTVSWEDRYMD